ncbi:hypothetical protein F2Q69_00032427 [Brassica cretica]|uniref:Uncharacterized protein n=1 Tax=Brassica cretica TaxID=69181 RepID=A0A8S9S976_BRACR|nr:hypothetical protein F2Q69_00032427 [Brassica cretica]
MLGRSKQRTTPSDKFQLQNRQCRALFLTSPSVFHSTHGKSLSEYQSMWNIKMQDLAMMEKLSKMKLLDSLLAKTEPLLDYEEALKKKLVTELLSN